MYLFIYLFIFPKRTVLHSDCTRFLLFADTFSHWPEVQSPVQVVWWTVPSHDRTVGTQTLSCPGDKNQRMLSDCFCIMPLVFSLKRDSVDWSECVYVNNWQIAPVWNLTFVNSLWSAGAECLWWCCQTSWCRHRSENTVEQLAPGVRLQKSPSLFLEE